MIKAQEEVTPEWLTEILYTNKVLTAGSVIELKYQKNAAFNSSVGHYELIYSAEVEPIVPRKVVIKLNGNEWGENEIELYKLVMAQSQPLPMLVPCYGADYEPATGNSYLMLKDISQTHAPPVTREQLVQGEGVASEQTLLQIIEALAEFHAYWWQHPQLGQPGSLTQVRWYRDKVHFDQHLERRRKEYAQFKADTRNEVPAKLLVFYDTIFANLPQLWKPYFKQRVLNCSQLTISPGDTYGNQFLCPKEGITDRSYLIDFQDAGANFGAFDLAYLMASFWTPQQRHYQKREEKLLRHYLEVLQANGVVQYGWQDLLTDYKLMIIFVMLIPLWDQTCGSGKAYWWPKMQCLTNNFLDLNCWELFETEKVK